MKFAKHFHHLQRAGILLALLTGGGLTACSQQGDSGAGRQRPLPPVTLLAAEPSDTTVYRDYPARIHGLRQVQLRARVAGILEKRRYEEGRVVATDDILFEIDAEPFEIALRRAEAEFDDARARYRHAERERTRYSRLYAQAAVSERERDRAETDAALARAGMDQADAARADARRNLRYTKVRAPVSGVTGMESVSEGNLIEYGQLLTTITQQDPVHVRFALPETDATIQRAARKALEGDNGPKEPFEAELIMPDGSAYAQKGAIDFTASTVNPETGSVTARAVFPNPDNVLAPGQFVRIRVQLEQLSNIYLIPETAVGQGEQGARVFVVNDDHIARERFVRTGPVVDGRQVILEGLAEGDRVVVNGHVALRDKMEVSVSGAAEEEVR